MAAWSRLRIAILIRTSPNGWMKGARKQSATALAVSLGLALLTSGCTQKEPPRPGEQSAIISTQSAPGSAFMMSLSLVPSQPRFGRKTRFRVTVRQTLGRLVEGAQVDAALVMPLMDMGKNQFPLKPASSGVYEAIGEFSMAGEWEVVINASAQGKTAKTTFNVNVAE
jgi:hypothetical protein